jgi:tetratricopeptide (TPR) repeat protein
MNKKLYLILAIIFCSLTAFVVIRYKGKLKNEEVAFYPLKERTGTAATLPEWASVRTSGDKLIRIVREKPEDVKSTLQLAALYLQEARITGDYEYYNKAALKYIDDVLAKEPNNFNALVLKANIQLTQHHFAEALQTAESAVKVNPYNAFVYGLMVDGNVEMGNYVKAVEHSDKMMSIRPDIRSYARVAYLREIHGDVPGAIEAMKMAVESGAYGDEGTEWCRVQLGRLYEQTGEVKHAEMHYTIAQNERPGYAPALLGLSRIAAVQKDLAKAMAYCSMAEKGGAKNFEHKEQMAYLHRLNGKVEDSRKLLQTVAEEMTAPGEGESGVNHHAGMELAHVYLALGQPKPALEAAQKEYNTRPDNIDVAETLGWAYYKAGDAAKAVTYLQQALRTGCTNPALLCRAGIVYAQAGDKAKAKTLLQAALKPNR